MPDPSVRQQRVWFFICLNVRSAENKAGSKASQELLSPLLAASPMAESKWSVTVPWETVRPLLPVKFYEAKLQMAYFGGGGQTTPTKQLYVPHNGLPNHPSVCTAFLTSLCPLTSHPGLPEGAWSSLEQFQAWAFCDWKLHACVLGWHVAAAGWTQVAVWCGYQSGTSPHRGTIRV